MKKYLDDMDQHYGGNGSYDAKFYKKLLKCMDKYDDEILKKS